MLKLIIVLVLFVTEAVSSQTNYENDKQNDLELFTNFKPDTMFLPNLEMVEHIKI